MKPKAGIIILKGSPQLRVGTSLLYWSPVFYILPIRFYFKRKKKTFKFQAIYITEHEEINSLSSSYHVMILLKVLNGIKMETRNPRFNSIGKYCLYSPCPSRYTHINEISSLSRIIRNAF